MQLVQPLSLAAMLAVAASLGACTDDGHDHSDHDHGLPDASVPDAPAARATVTLDFAHLVAGAPVTIGTETPYTNAAGNRFGVTVVRYFISNVRLGYADGSQVDAPGAHYVDHDTAATRTYPLTDVPVGALTSVSFVMGLPPALNVTGAFTAPPESLMEWPAMMGGGYHYLKFEGRYLDRSGAPFAFRAHSGPLGGTDYSFPVALDATGRAVTAAGTTLTIEMNLEEWFTNPNDWDLNDYFNAGHPGIMNDAAAQASLRANGAGVFSLGPS